MGRFVLVVHLTAKQDQVEKFMEMALENAAKSRSAEAGCRQFDVLVDPQDSTRISFYEVYDDAEAFEAHQKTEHFRDYLKNAVPLLDSRERMFFDRVAP